MDAGDGRSVAKLTAVVLGNRRAGEVEVMDGLSAGDVVVTAGLLKIRDGVPVQVLESGGPSPPPVAQNKPVTG